MSINPNQKNLTTLNKAAIKVLGDKPMVWYAVAIGSDYIFGIDKKITDPSKFKKVDKIQKYLEKLKVDTKGMSSQAAAASGLLVKSGDAIQLSVVCKINGGGKSILKAVLKDATGKKLIPNPELVKSIGAQTDQQKSDSAREEALDVAVEQELLENQIPLSKETKTAIKYFLWWKQGAKDTYLAGIQSPDTDNEDDLLKINSRLRKFAERKLYKLFESHLFKKDGPLAKYSEQDFDLTKPKLKEYFGNLKTAFAAIEKNQDGIELDEEASVDAADELASIVDDLDTIAELMGLDPKELPSFKACVQANKPVWKVLWSDFASNPTALIDLKNGLANGTWEDFFKIAKQFEGK